MFIIHLIVNTLVLALIVILTPTIILGNIGFIIGIISKLNIYVEYLKTIKLNLSNLNIKHILYMGGISSLISTIICIIVGLIINYLMLNICILLSLYISILYFLFYPTYKILKKLKKK